MSAYIKRLQRGVAQALAATAQERDPHRPLKRRITEWHSSLPMVSRARKFSMVKIRKAVGAAQQEVGPALLELGWRHRRHHTTVANIRYWTPPGFVDPPRRNTRDPQ